MTDDGWIDDVHLVPRLRRVVERSNAKIFGVDRRELIGLLDRIDALEAALTEPAMTEWRPIESAPKDDMFWVWRKSTNGPARVQRFDTPGFENSVIDPLTGRHWFAKHWLPEAALPAPPTEEG